MKRIRLVAKLIESRISTQITRGYVVERVVMELCNDNEVISQWTTDRDHIRTSLSREFNRHPYSDNLTVQFYDQTDECIWEGGYEVYSDKEPETLKPIQPITVLQPQVDSTLNGPTPEDLGALVEQKVQQIRQVEELERLRSEQVKLNAKNEALQGQVETLEAQIEAKSNLEYYSKVAGDLLPGIAKALEKTSLGPALSGLAGEQTQKDDQTTVMDSAKALIEACGEEQLSAFYMLVLEFQNNPDLIPVIYQNAFSNETAH
ncbi:MAG: hypothetical protein ACPGAJ_06285 [Schleiferiaceae bacterium]|jgi:hypothetical protein